ncbi:S9 family peptidase [Prolixibacteraceae bacterium JC049]|nr:S9 family peptidase [Prolixibacteraceae bacterium JC049]
MRSIITLLLLLTFSVSWAQLDVAYQKPHPDILSLADVPTSPSTWVTRDMKNMLLMETRQYASIQELAQKEYRLAGLRINPKTNGSSRNYFYYGIKIKRIETGEVLEVKGLPENVLLSKFSWSPDQSKIAFTNTVENGVELWVLDLGSAKAKRLSEAVLNPIMGDVINWKRDGSGILVKVLPKERGRFYAENPVPKGPIISENLGQKAQNRTYQDLLKNKTDEANFDYFTTSELYLYALDGQRTKWQDKAVYSGVSISPDGNYVLITRLSQPYSYLVPYYRFTRSVDVYDMNGKHVKQLAEIPLTEELPKGFDAVRLGQRSHRWRSDKGAVMTWVEALDGGDPAKKVEYRDVVYQQAAPFTEEPKELIRTKNRYDSIIWGTDNIALAVDYWWASRNLKTYLFNPSDNKQKPEILEDRSTQDRYSDPGSPVRFKNQYGRYVMHVEKGRYIYLKGAGHSPEGPRPFLDKFDLKKKKITRLYRAKNDDHYEYIARVIDLKKGELMVSIQSKTEYPNYYIRNYKKKSALKQITFNKNPYEIMSKVHKEVIKYKRNDGVELSGTLYLPPNYDRTKKEKLPMVMWAYPVEYKDKRNAGQVTKSKNTFTYLWYGTPVYWALRGYAILDGASFPIVGEGENEPNDTFLPQLIANAKAAIDAVDSLGYIDRNRVAVGGHSYGAFMTANLLTHSDLFAAGIARSGAYNRTLTPFGFQSEERSYWDAPQIYNTMSPFMNASKMKHPLLLIHGKADNNSGTYPMQSERYFNALKGLGGTVRLVMLPFESHSYRARESVLHVLWEQDQWLEKYVKNKK